MAGKRLINSLHRQEAGQDVLEYALVLGALLAVVVAGSEAIATVIGNGVAKIDGKITSIVH